MREGEKSSALSEERIKPKRVSAKRLVATQPKETGALEKSRKSETKGEGSWLPGEQQAKPRATFTVPVGFLAVPPASAAAMNDSLALTELMSLPIPSLEQSTLKLLAALQEQPELWTVGAWQAARLPYLELAQKLTTEGNDAVLDALVEIQRKAPSPDLVHDGKIVGGDGKTYPGKTTALKDVPPYLPSNGKKPTRLIIHVNGILTTLAEQQKALQILADQTGAAVIGVHNATQGFDIDIAQAWLDKFNRGYNPATETVGRLINSAMIAGEELNLTGHSQGALIIARTLQVAETVLDRMVAKGKISPEEKTRRFSQVVVETYGGAAREYPDGPQYRHVYNGGDIVPMLTGLGTPMGVSVKGGKGARTERFYTFGASIDDTHDFIKVYLKWRSSHLQ